MVGLESKKSFRHEVQRRLPRRPDKASVRPPDERRRQTRRMARQLARREPLDAHLTLVQGKVLVRTDLGLSFLRRRDRHAALERAVGAVGARDARGRLPRDGKRHGDYRRKWRHAMGKHHARNGETLTLLTLAAQNVNTSAA